MIRTAAPKFISIITVNKNNAAGLRWGFFLLLTFSCDQKKHKDK